MNDSQVPNPDLPVSKVRPLVKKTMNFKQLQQSIKPSVDSFKHKYLGDCTESILMKPFLAGSNGNATKYLFIKLLGMFLTLGLRYTNGYANIELFLHFQNKFHWSMMHIFKVVLNFTC